MAKNDKHHKLFENWRKYLKEYEEEPEDEDHKGSGKYYIDDPVADIRRATDDGPGSAAAQSFFTAGTAIQAADAAADAVGGILPTLGGLLGGGFIAKKLGAFGFKKAGEKAGKVGFLAAVKQLGVRGVLGQVLTKGVPIVGTGYLAYEVVDYFFGDDASKEEKEKAAKDLEKDPSFLDSIKRYATDFYKEHFEKETDIDRSGAKSGPIDATEADEDALLRMLYAETSWNRTEKEMAAIIQVAINRKTLRNEPDFASVVRPLDSGWNNGSSIALAKRKELKYQQDNPGKTKKFGSYEENYNKAHEKFNSKKAQEVRVLIKNMLAGQGPIGNLGGAQNWLHAGAMKPCTEPHGTKIGSRYCFDYSTLGMPFGKRVIPTWAIQKGNGPGQLPVGISKTKPGMVGQMVYSNANSRAVASASRTTNESSADDTDIAIIGDSLMDQTGVYKKDHPKAGQQFTVKSIGYYISQAFPGRVTNIASGGSPMHGGAHKTMPPILTQFTRIPESTKVLVVNGGVNDLAGHQYRKPESNLAGVIDGYSSIINQAKEKGIKVVIFPVVVPYNRKSKKQGTHPDSAPTELSRSLNSRLQAMADGNSVLYVEGFEEVSVRDRRTNLHPGKYYKSMAKAISEKIREASS